MEVEKEFPILCETCLGENPLVRMTREPHGKACKICDRPFTVFRWRPGPHARYKKTELCQTCAKLKNVCQTCVLDLQFGLPVQVRDSALEEFERMKMPTSDVNRNYLIEQAERGLDVSGNAISGYHKADTSAMLMKLRRKQPYYQRNRAHICSFWVAGKCNRGDACPFRHEMPVTGELANQNIKDRFYGQNDPVAKKLMNRMSSHSASHDPGVPEDNTVTTVWIGNLDEKTGEEELRSMFYTYGDISSLRVVRDKACAFITYSLRSSAEEAIAGAGKDPRVRGLGVKVAWGRKQQSLSGVPAPPGIKKAPLLFSTDPNAYTTDTPDGSAPAPPPVFLSTASLPPPPGVSGTKPYYPSMDPKNMAAKMI